MSGEPHRVTTLLRTWSEGDDSALDEPTRLVCDANRRSRGPG